MNLAFYYHIPITIKEGGLYIPGYLGVFITSLAKEVESLYLLMHESRPGSSDVEEADYQLNESNISWVTLGIKTPAWHRDLFHRIILSKAVEKIEHCDCLLVRSPSPLAPYFHYYTNNVRVIFMVVGDYREGAKHARPNSLRDWLVLKYVKYNDRIFVKAMKHTDVIVNSAQLFWKYQHLSKSIFQIRTTTLSEDDFFKRTDTCHNEVIQLLYTGRIDPAKGLFELIEALPLLYSRNIHAVLNIVGWESDHNKPVENALRQKSTELGVASQLVFHGRRTVGPDLNAMYRMADIYLIPSYHEGFPRTIWEAMANSLPVVATRVGGIPAFLQDEENALFISPKSVNDICFAVERLINDTVLRQRLISNGQTLARENTQEKQTKLLIEIIKEYAQKQADSPT